MEYLLKALSEIGINPPENTNEKQVFAIAKAMGIDPEDHIPRKVEVVDYTNKYKETNKFVKTPSFVIGLNDKGKKQRIQGLFLRVDALDQAIEDLLAARDMLAVE